MRNSLPLRVWPCPYMFSDKFLNWSYHQANCNPIMATMHHWKLEFQQNYDKIQSYSELKESAQGDKFHVPSHIRFGRNSAFVLLLIVAVFSWTIFIAQASCSHTFGLRRDADVWATSAIVSHYRVLHPNLGVDYFLISKFVEITNEIAEIFLTCEHPI